MEKLLGFIAIVVFVMWVFKPEDDEAASNTRCPGDEGSMLYKALTPIGDDCNGETAQAAPEPVEMTVADYRLVARNRCRRVIETVLNDPGSVQWDDGQQWRITDDAENTWTVYPTLRAANALGATVRATFRCQVQIDGDDWELLALEEI